LEIIGTLIASFFFALIFLFGKKIRGARACPVPPGVGKKEKNPW